MLLQDKASPDATEDARGIRASMLLTGLLKVMLGYQRGMPESLADAKLDATRLLPKVGQADMHERAALSALIYRSLALLLDICA